MDVKAVFISSDFVENVLLTEDDFFFFYKNTVNIMNTNAVTIGILHK